MAPHSSTLAQKIPWTEEPGVLQSMGSLRVGHDRVTSLSLFPFMHWRSKWQPTPVFLPWESQGWDCQGWDILALRIPDGLPSMGSHRVGHDWSDLAAAATRYLVYVLNAGKEKLKTLLRTSGDFCRKDTGIIDSTFRKIKVAEFKCKF